MRLAIELAAVMYEGRLSPLLILTVSKITNKKMGLLMGR